MKKTIFKTIKNVLCIAFAIGVLVSLTPVNLSQSHAANFSTTGTVKNLAVKYSSYDTVILKWDEYKNADGYQVFRAEAGGSYVKLKNIRATSYKNVVNVKTGTKYYYKVRAYQKTPSVNWTHSKFSKPVSVTPSVAKVKLNHVYAKANGPHAYWSSVDGATGYCVYRADSISGPFTKIATTSKLNYSDVSTEKAKKYYYKVRAYRTVSGTKKYGAASSILVSMRKLDTPKVSISGDNRGVILDWESVQGAEGYVVYRKSESNKDYVKYDVTHDSVFINTKTTIGKKYSYKIKAYTKLGDRYVNSEFSDAVTKVRPPLQFDPNGKVETIKATGTSDYVKIEWSAQPKATAYQLYRASSAKGPYTKIDTNLTSRIYKNTSIITGKTYYYKVRAYKKTDDGITLGKFSDVVNATPPIRVPSIKTVSENEGVRINWESQRGAKGYVVYRATTRNGQYSRIGSTKKLTYLDKEVNRGKPYFYKVKVYKTIGDKTRYGELSSSKVGLKKLSKPSVKLVGSNSGITIKWNAITGADGYIIYRKTSSGGYEKYATVRDTEYLNSKTTIGNKYYYIVKAYKKVDTRTFYSSSSDYKYLTRPEIKFVPEDSVEDLRVTSVTSERVKLAWSKQTKATGYQVYRSTSKDGDYTKLQSGITDLNLTNSSIQVGTTYYYKVRAYSVVNGKTSYGKFSSVVKATPKLKTPVLSAKCISTGVKLSWESIPGATGYVIYRCKTKDGTYKLYDAVGSAKNEFTVTKMNLSQKYYYKIKASKTYSNRTSYSNYSNIKEGMKPLPAPTASAKEVSTGIKVTWDKISGAAGYYLYRSTAKNGTYTKYAEITTNSFVNTKVTKGTKYYYKVRAYAIVNGVRVYGVLSKNQYSRTVVVDTAKAWLGCKERDGSHKKIIDVYNSNIAPGCYAMNYRAPWCAAFVSAVAVKSKTTAIIIRGTYCPTMLSQYKSKGQYAKGRSYVPKPGDIIFFDWNYNGSPDHVGMVQSVSGKTVTTIEGNKSDSVSNRTFTVGSASWVLAYGLPKYDDACGVAYTGSIRTSSTASTFAIDRIEGDLGGYDEIENALIELFSSDSTYDDEFAKVEYIAEYVKSHVDVENSDRADSNVYADYVLALCERFKISACRVDEDDENGSRISHVEVCVGDQWYIVDPASDEAVTEFTQPQTDVEDVEAMEDTEDVEDVEDVESAE